MAKIESAKKAHRGSEKKKQHNLFWKKRIKAAQKAFVPAEKESLVNLQSVLDKAANNKVLHKNKASRLKARFAKKLAIQK
jgi:ribosomal protein S20